MALGLSPSPYLLTLLARGRKTDPTLPYDDPNDPDPTPVESPGPTISMRPRATVTDAQQAPPPYLQARVVQPAVTAQSPTIPITAKPVDVIAQDRQRLIDAQGKHHSKARDVLEGLGQWAGSGVGLNVHKLIYPRGTETEQAQRQLNTDLGLQKVATDEADAQSTIALRGSQVKENEAQARKIQDAIDNPDTSDEDKRKLEALRESLRLHPQPFDANDPNDIELLKRAKDAGILIPSAYGKTAPQREPLIKERKNADGSTTSLKSTDYGKTWEEVPELASAAPDKPQPDDVPDTTKGFADLEASHRKNAADAQANAEKVEGEVKAYIASQKAADPNYDSAKDPNVASMTAEARRQRAYQTEQLGKADAVAAKKIEAGATDTRVRARVKKSAPRGGLTPKTHGFSLSGWLSRNPGKTEADARAFHNGDSKYRSYKIIP